MTGGATSAPATHRPSAKVVWGARLGYLVMRLLASTWRISRYNDAPWRALYEKKQPYIFALWHGELLPLLWAHRTERNVILVSEHGDGEIIARIIERLGLETVRGSTTRGGSRALLGMIRMLDAGAPAAFTPDGPRGPRHVWQPGVLSAARRANAPIVCIGIAVASAWRFRSWDQFVLPKPFARIAIAYSDPLLVDATLANIADDAPRFTQEMHAASERASEALRRA